MFIQNDRWRIAKSFQNVQIDFRVTFEFIFGGEKKYERKAAFLDELASDYKAVSAVVSFPAENRDCEVLEVFESILQDFGHTHARILHQD